MGAVYRRTRDEEALVERLRALRERGFELDEQEVWPLTLEIAGNLGSPDPELRDELGLTALGTWIVEHGRLEPVQLRELGRHALGEDGIRHRLGAHGDDSVFLRSFSLLVLAILLVADEARRYMEKSEWREIVDGLADYCERERDLRGYVRGAGWAHAAAHAADVAEGCVTSRFSTPETCERLLAALDRLVAHAGEVFQAEEDERIAIALAAMISSGRLSTQGLVAFLNERDLSVRAYNTNWKHILRSLHFRLGAAEAEARRQLEAAQARLALRPDVVVPD